MYQIKTILITCLCAASATLITACNSGGSGASAATTPSGSKNYSLSMPALNVFTDQMDNSQVINIGGTPVNDNYACNFSGFYDQEGIGSCNSISDSNSKPAMQLYYSGMPGSAAMYTGAQINLPPSPFSDNSASFQPQLVALGGSLSTTASFVAMGATQTASSLYFGAVCDSPGKTCRTNTVAGYLALPDGTYVAIALLSQAVGTYGSAYNELYLIGDTSNTNSNYTCSNSPNGISCTTYLNNQFEISLSRQNNLLGTLSINNMNNARTNSANQSFLQMNQIVGSYNQTCYSAFATIAPIGGNSGMLGAACSQLDGSLSGSLSSLTNLSNPQSFSNSNGQLASDTN